MKIVITISLLLTISIAKSQIIAERASQETIGYKIYILEKNTIIDSIQIPRLYSEFSFYLSDNTQVIYLVYSAIGSDPKTHYKGKTYYIDEYVFNRDKQMIRSCQYWIEQSKYENLFEKGFRLELTRKGLEISFDRGKIVQITLDYKELDFDKLHKELSKISKW